jgi:hypothetical protein
VKILAKNENNIICAQPKKYYGVVVNSYPHKHNPIMHRQWCALNYQQLKNMDKKSKLVQHERRYLACVET